MKRGLIEKHEFFFIVDHQDIEKEMRKEVDEAIAQAKVRWFDFHLESWGGE